MDATHVVSVLGSKLDAIGHRRWDRWRPTVGLASQDDLSIARLDLLYTPRDKRLFATTVSDLASVSPHTVVVGHPVDWDDPWDLEEVWSKLHDIVQKLPMDVHPEGPLVHITTGTHIMQICWFLLVESGLLPGRLLQSSPGKRRADPIGQWKLIDLQLARYDAIARRFEAHRQRHLSALKGGIPTRNPSFNALVDRIETVALHSEEPILLMGPTGAGKTRLARRIHALRAEKNPRLGPLIEVDCTTLRGDAAMSTLFGHVRGAYTGAEHPRQGLIRAAEGGTLFLDEIGDLGVDEQAMLLRALEDGLIRPVGADTLVHCQFQLLAGTHCDLYQRVREGRFRADLLARLDVWSFRLPSLAERPEDIEPNLSFELQRQAERMGRTLRFHREARDQFLHAATQPQATWTGNFRDLRAAVLRMATLCPDGIIDQSAVTEELARLRRRWQGGDGPERSTSTPYIDTFLPLAQREALDPFDAFQLEGVLRTCAAHPTQAAAGRALFAQSRTRKATSNDGDRLRKYLAKWNLKFSEIQRIRTNRPQY